MVSKQSLEEQFKVTMKALKPNHELHDSLKQMFKLLGMFYRYLEDKRGNF